MNGAIALSMEIGSQYVLQVCLLQIPALVLFSAVYGHFIEPKQIIDHTFSELSPLHSVTLTSDSSWFNHLRSIFPLEIFFPPNAAITNIQ
jgi:Ca2+/H+ antiporter